MSSITDLLTPTEAPAGPMPGFLLATVSENSNKSYPAMVRVEFTAWQQGSSRSKWLPLLCAYAGKEHGQYLVPEVGDVVLVGFIGPGLERPFILGSLFPPGAALPGELYTDKNLTRQLKTKGGVSVTVSDEDGKHCVQVETPKGLKLSLDDSGEAVVIGDKNDKNALRLEAKNGAVSLEADKKLSLKAGGCELTMETGGALTIKCDRLKVEAKQTASVKGGNMATLEGGMLTVEGKQQLALKGTAVCEISGGLVKIN